MSKGADAFGGTQDLSMRRFSILFLAAFGWAAVAAAQTPSAAPPAGVEWRRYARAGEVQIRDTAAIIFVTPESRPDIAVAVVHRGGVPALELSGHGRRLLVDGQQARAMACRVEEGGAFQAETSQGWLGADRLPTIYLRVPREVALNVSGAAQIHMRRGESVRLRMTGCGDVDIEGVDGAADISVAGDRPRVRLYDAGAASVRIAGDGDILLGVVRESLAVSIAGDGDLVAAHVDGPTNIAITGEGEALIREGRAQPMSVTILGNGRVTHNGTADRLDVAILGDGEVRVARVDGAVNRRVFGDGRVSVGPR